MNHAERKGGRRVVGPQKTLGKQILALSLSLSLSLPLSLSLSLLSLFVICQLYFLQHCVCVCVCAHVSSVCVWDMHPVNTFFFFMCYHKGGNVYVSISLCVKSCVNRRIPSIVACQDWAGTSICNDVCVFACVWAGNGSDTFRCHYSSAPS